MRPKPAPAGPPRREWLSSKSNTAADAGVKECAISAFFNVSRSTFGIGVEQMVRDVSTSTETGCPSAPSRFEAINPENRLARAATRGEKTRSAFGST
jgi:hypothetical protein